MRKPISFVKKRMKQEEISSLPMKNTVMFPVTKPDARVFPKR